MTIVYELYHEYEDETGADEIKKIGTYSSLDRAKQAVERLKEKPGFRDLPAGFNIYECHVDLDGWTEGFIKANPNDPYSKDYDYDERGHLKKRIP